MEEYGSSFKIIVNIKHIYSYKINLPIVYYFLLMYFGTNDLYVLNHCLELNSIYLDNYSYKRASISFMMTS